MHTSGSCRSAKKSPWDGAQSEARSEVGLKCQRCEGVAAATRNAHFWPMFAKFGGLCADMADHAVSDRSLSKLQQAAVHGHPKL